MYMNRFPRTKYWMCPWVLAFQNPKEIVIYNCFRLFKFGPFLYPNGKRTIFMFCWTPKFAFVFSFSLSLFLFCFFSFVKRGKPRQQCTQKLSGMFISTIRVRDNRSRLFLFINYQLLRKTCEYTTFFAVQFNYVKLKNIQHSSMSYCLCI